MELIITFVTVLSWVGLVLSAITLAIRIRLDYMLNNTKQGELYKFLNSSRGRDVSVPLMWPGIIFLLSAVWIISKWLN